MSTSSSWLPNILNLPDDILIEIILYLNARERVALGNSCERFENLVFGNEELLRDLDFSHKGRFTTVADVRQYFSNANISKHVVKANFKNVICLRVGIMLNNFIGRAINLVDLNIHGTKFKDIKQMAEFLDPLVNLDQLSIDWPRYRRSSDPICCTILKEPLSRLKYLSIDVGLDTRGAFFDALYLCQNLSELYIHKVSQRLPSRENTPKDIPLRNLKIVQVCGNYFIGVKEFLMYNMLPDHKESEWTDFNLDDIYGRGSFYIEKDLQVCKELSNVKLKGSESLPFPHGYIDISVGWVLIFEYLLKEAIAITHEDVLENFCSLTRLPNARRNMRPCLLKIDETKRLLKNRAYQVSYLYFKHVIESDCDAHLVASAFPNLTELVLSNIVKRSDAKASQREKKKHFKRRLRRKDSNEPEELDDPANLDSSFQMLVENTPHVRDLTIYADDTYRSMETLQEWDLDALCLIPRWKNLTVIRLKHIPIKDGDFLIEIGKECVKLEELNLNRLGPQDSCCYMSGLSEMLKYCKNLQKFSIFQHQINMPEAFASLLNNSKLRVVRFQSKTKEYDFVKLISSIEELLRQCTELITFQFTIFAQNRGPLKSTLQKIVRDLNRPNFQFCGPSPMCEAPTYEDASSSYSPHGFDSLQIT